MNDIDNIDHDSKFELLSDEIVLTILSFLNQYELHLTVALVCKKWFQLSRDPALLKRMVLKGDTFGKTEHIVDILSCATLLEDLRIRCRDDAVILLQTVAQFSGRRLQKIQINYCPSLTEECTSLLAKNCTNLKSVNINETGTISEIATSHLTQIRYLQSIDLFNCKYVLPDHVMNIAQNCDSLQKINLGEVTHLNDECIDMLLRLRKGSLKVLVLDGEDLSDNAFSNLSSCDKLEEFDLSFAENLGSRVLNELSHLKKLKRLRYSRGKLLTKHDFIAAFGTKNLSCLTDIDFSECNNFDDEGLVCVSNVCQGLSQVTVDWCEDLTDEGILFMISKCQQLHYLKLVGLFRITDKILDSLIQKLPKLRYLNLVQCPNITDNLLQYLSSENSLLDIFDYYGNQVNCDLLTEDYMFR